ncbi:MAG: hypothetical protein ACFFCC_19415 [Promethearchaeota archaeon]
MPKLRKNENFTVNNGEEILYRTKEIEDKFFVILGFSTGIIGITLLIVGFFYLQIFASVFGFIGFTILALGLLTYFIFFIFKEVYSSHIIYYVTSERVIKFISKIKFLKKQKKFEIPFSEISHIIGWQFGIEIIQKKSNGESYYNGGENEVFQDNADNSILIKLNGHKGKILINEIFNLLEKEVPLVKHPHLDGISYQE